MFVAPSWKVDPSALGETLDRLRSALERPAVSGIGAGALGLNRQGVASSLKLILEEIDKVDLNAIRALSGLVREFRPQSQADVLHELFTNLHAGWRQLITRVLGETKLLALRRLVSSATPDLLRILGREDDENSHSDLIAWLLSPKRAPNVAPQALLHLVARLENADQWCNRINTAVASGLVSIRREMLIGRDLAGSDDLCRVDLVVSGPGFVLAIENKVWAHEHWDQTTTYWGWLEPMKCLRAGLFLSPSGLTAACPSFAPVSYLELVSALLEGPARGPISATEEIVLASYLKTLQRYILPVEMKAAVDAARALEAK